LNDRRLAFANRSFPFAYTASKADGKNQRTNECQQFSHRSPHESMPAIIAVAWFTSRVQAPKGLASTPSPFYLAYFAPDK